MKFKTKIDWWVHLLFALVVVCPIPFAIKAIVLEEVRVVMIIATALFFVCSVFMVHIWLATHYTIAEDKLIIRSGVFYKAILLTHIVKVNPRFSLISSPALSMDRMDIVYKTSKGKMRNIFISPKDKEEFLYQINQRIQHAPQDIVENTDT